MFLWRVRFHAYSVYKHIYRNTHVMANLLSFVTETAEQFKKVAIANRSPTSGETKTPVELFYGAKPIVIMMRTF